MILNKIKSYYKIKSDAIFASFLGIKPNTLANWRTRNTLDYSIVITKCVDIDANWLLTGEGDMIKKTDSYKNHSNILAEPKEPYGKQPLNTDNSKDLIIETQQKLIIALQKNIELMEEKLRVEQNTNVKATRTEKAG